MWRKGNPLALLVGMEIDTASMDNSMEVPYKTKNRTTIWPSKPTTGHKHWENHNSKWLISVLFMIARTWKQPKCSSTDEWIKKMWHIYTVDYYSAIKVYEIELFVMRWMDLVCHMEWSKSEREKQIPYANTYI